MPQEIIEDDSIRDVVRLHNRALRTLNKNIRRKLEQVRKETDETVAALFEAPSEAESALAAIHNRLQLDCDPLDYEAIVNIATQL